LSVLVSSWFRGCFLLVLFSCGCALGEGLTLLL
jgi:hypothetical protein